MSQLREIRVYPAPRKLLAFLAISVVFVLAGLFIIGTIGDYDARWGAVDTVIGYAAIGFFGLGACYFGFRLLARKPSLVIDEDGIVDNASALAAGRISWHEVADVRATSYRSQRFLVIRVRDEAELLARQPRVKAMLMRVNKALGGGALVWVPMLAVPMSEAELLTEIGRRAAA